MRRAAYQSNDCSKVPSLPLPKILTLSLDDTMAKQTKLQANNQSNQAPQKSIGFNIYGNIAFVEREAFGKIPFHKIVKAMEGALDKDGNIIIVPHLLGCPKDEAVKKAYQLRYLDHFLEFAYAVRNHMGFSHLFEKYEYFVLEIRRLKDQYEEREEKCTFL